MSSMSGGTPERELDVDTLTYLAHAVAIVRARGFVPAGAVDTQPTWRGALERLHDGVEPAAADRVRAHQILGWVASLHPRDPDGYRARIAACLAHERLAPEDLPLAASAVRAFNLHLYHEIRGRKHDQELQIGPDHS